MSATAEIKGRVHVTPQLQTSKNGKLWTVLVIYDGYEYNGQTIENYYEIKFFGDKAEKVCNEITEDMHLIVKTKLVGDYQEYNQKTFYKLQILGIETAMNEPKPKAKPTQKTVSPVASDDGDDSPF